MFLIQPAPNTFTRHFSQDMMGIDTPMAIMPGKLFDNFHANRKNISGYLFQASNINQEIIEFIQTFKGNTKIYLYFDKFNLQLYNDASSIIKCIVREETINSKGPSIKQKNTIKIGPMYSENLLYSSNLQQPEICNQDILADMSDLEKIPESLEKVLYPNTKLRIKLFNNTSINHFQNLGFVDDHTMISMINECRAYIDTNTNYLLYALILDKPTVALETNSILKKTKEINESTFDKVEGSKIELNHIIKNSYKNFIQKYIL